MALLQSIGPWRLAGYFEDLDTVKEFGLRDMSRARNILLELHAGVNEGEAAAIAKAWSETYNGLDPHARASIAIAAENGRL